MDELVNIFKFARSSNQRDQNENTTTEHMLDEIQYYIDLISTFDVHLHLGLGGPGPSHEARRRSTSAESKLASANARLQHRDEFNFDFDFDFFKVNL